MAWYPTHCSLSVFHYFHVNFKYIFFNTSPTSLSGCNSTFIAYLPIIRTKVLTCYINARVSQATKKMLRSAFSVPLQMNIRIISAWLNIWCYDNFVVNVRLYNRGNSLWNQILVIRVGHKVVRVYIWMFLRYYACKIAFTAMFALHQRLRSHLSVEELFSCIECAFRVAFLKTNKMKKGPYKFTSLSVCL